MMEKILNDIEAQEQNMVSFLKRLVNIDSGVDNPEGIQEVAKIVGDRLEKIGLKVQYLEHPEICTQVLAHKDGSSEKNVMIMGHMDTVFPKGTAAARPFTIIDGKAYGPGVLDMKSGITISLFTLEAMYKNGWHNKNITVLFLGDEEPGHPKTDAVKLIEREATGKDAVFNMETGRVDGGVVIGRKGCAFPELFIKGQSAHAGNDPWNGISANRELGHKIVDLENLNNYDKGIFVNVGIVNGGRSQSIIPDEAYAKMAIRFSSKNEAEQVMSAVKKIAEHTYVPGTQTQMANEQIMYMPMETTSQVKGLFKLVQEQGKKLGLPEISGVVMGAGSDAAWPSQIGVPIVCSMGARGEFNHSDREFILINSLVERAKLLALCIDAV